MKRFLPYLIILLLFIIPVMNEGLFGLPETGKIEDQANSAAISNEVKNKTQEVKDPVLYPNPVEDKFMLNNALGVEKLEIYNIAGKKMMGFQVSPGNEYQVNDLRNGIYLVRLIGKQGKVLKVIRLSKR